MEHRCKLRYEKRYMSCNVAISVIVLAEQAFVVDGIYDQRISFHVAYTHYSTNSTLSSVDV